ncbi:acyl carrier protein [Azohydromonas aeria]|uniref:acyl carrier protein n=1 Tax=Azohydromonas aeria TaxID=2590212 RepID=UPI0012FC1144|nr:phosphopantetheine-binding protein [Azohydromonas aeria]
MSTTFERLSAILARDYKLAPDQLTLDAPLEGLGIDSLGTMELLWTVEESFGITLPPDQVALPTLGDVVRYIDDLVAAQAAQAADAAPGPAAAPTLGTP